MQDQVDLINLAIILEDHGLMIAELCPTLSFLLT